MKTQITKKLFKIILLAGVLIIFSLNQAKATIALCINESGQSPLAPELINDADAQVDDTIKIAFVDESNWRLAIYAIQIKDIALPDSVFHILPNEIQIYPFKYKGLQIAGVYNFTVMALGFPNVEISQKVKHGKTSTLDISAVPYTPNMEDGTLSNQPVIKLYDKFENLCVDDNYTIVAIIPSSSNWTLTGQLTKSAVNGKVTFTGLKAFSDYQQFVSLTFTSTGLESVTCEPFVINSPPIAYEPKISGMPKVNAILTGTYLFFDSEHDKEQSSLYRWYVADSINGIFDQLVGEGITYTTQPTDLYKWLKFEVIPVSENIPQYGKPFISNAIQVENSPPYATGIGLSEVPFVGKTITEVYDYFDVDADREGESKYRWLISKNRYGPFVAIENATSRHFTPARAYSGKWLVFEVTPISGLIPATGQAMSSKPVKIMNTAPVAQTVTMSGTLVVGSTIKVTYRYFDIDGDRELNTLFAWYRGSTENGSDRNRIENADKLNYTLAKEDAEQYIFCEVIPQAMGGVLSGLPVLCTSLESVAHVAPVIQTTDVKVDENTTGIFTIIQSFDLEDDIKADSAYLIVAGNKAGHFNLDPSNGELSIEKQIDYEVGNVYFPLQISVADSNNLHCVKIINIFINNTNDIHPKFKKPTYSFEIDENPAITSVIAKIEATDADKLQPLKYTLIDESNSLSINDKGEIIISNNLKFDFEAIQSLNLDAFVTDGQWIDSCIVTINIKNINDNKPEFVGTPYQFTVLENTINSINTNTIGKILANDPDELEPLSYSILTEQSIFSVAESTGIISLLEPALLNSEISKNYSLLISTNDGLNVSYATVEIAVRNVNEPPLIDKVADIYVIEDCGELKIRLSGIQDGDNSVIRQKIAITASSDNTELIPSIEVIYKPFYSLAELRTTPKLNAVGSAKITITLTDDGGIENGGNDTFTFTFNLSVEPKNDPPLVDSVTQLLIIDEDAGQQILTITGIDDGDTEVKQELNFSVTTDSPELISALPESIDFDGISTAKFAFSTFPNKFGTGNITLIISDNGKYGNGNENTTLIPIKIRVVPVNDLPKNVSSEFFGNEDMPITIPLSSFNQAYTDFDNQPLKSVIIEMTPDHAILLLNGNPVIENQVIDINSLINLQLTPNAGWSGTDKLIWKAAAMDGDYSNSSVISFKIKELNDIASLVIHEKVLIYAGDTVIQVNGIKLTDGDGDTQQFEVELEAEDMLIEIIENSGIELNKSYPNQTKKVLFTGNLSAVNLAIASIKLKPAALFSGTSKVLVKIYETLETGNNLLVDSILIKPTNRILFQRQPISQVKCSGENIVLSVSVFDFQNVEYQWKKNGINIEGENNQLLLIDNAKHTDSGNYTCVVSNVYARSSSEIAIIDIPEISYAINIQNVKCNGDSTGGFHVVADLDQALKFKVNNNTTVETAYFGNLKASEYQLQISDKNGCSVNTEVIVNQPLPLSANISATEVTCNGRNNGTIKIEASGGNGRYTYQLADKLQTTNLFTGLKGGNYTISITDANQCSISKDAVIVEDAPLAMVCTPSDLHCYRTGRIVINATGGRQPYNLLWTSYQHSGRQSNVIPDAQNMLVIEDLEPSEYAIELIDSKGCKISTITSVRSPQPLTITKTKIKDVFCTDDQTGELEVQVNGGVPDYSYSIDGENYQKENKFSNLRDTVYQLFVKDANDCIINELKQINASYTPKIDFYVISQPVDSESELGGIVNFFPVFQDIDSCYFNWGDNTQTAWFHPIMGQNLSHWFKLGTTYITLMAKSKCGSVTASKQIDVVFVCCSSVNQTDENSDLSIYPNPNSGKFDLQIQSQDVINSLETKVYDMLGNIIFTKKSAVDNTTFNDSFDLSPLASGIYWLECVYNGRKVVRKVAINNW